MRTALRAFGKGRRAFGLILAALLAIWLSAEAYAEARGIAFRRGIGISHVMAWAPLEAAPSREFVFPPFSYPEAAFARELSALRRAGFDFVRFAVDPGPFLQWQDSRRDALEQTLLREVRLILSHDLSVIVDFHPSDMHPDYAAEKIAAGVDAPLFRRYLALLSRTSGLLGALNSPRVALELMNEPPPRAFVWRPMREAAYAAARSAAPKLLLVLDGGEEGNLDGTITLDGYPADPNILFSFHYYRPWQFTHQGLAGMAAQYLTDVPYPAAARAMQESVAATTATIDAAALGPSLEQQATVKARRDLEAYRVSAFDRTTIVADFDKVARWAREHRVPAERVILGEFGAMNNAQRGNATRQAERMRWFADVRAAAEAHGFAWAAWVHSGSIGFALVTHEGSTELDPDTLRALGFE